MPNLKNIIDSNNKNASAKKEEPKEKKCNCRSPAACPLKGNCLAKSVIYQAKVTSEHGTETYVGLTETEFKTRYNNHKNSFNNPNKKLSTELSKYIWQLKEKEAEFGIEWSIIGQAKPYSNISKSCSLCIYEKYIIICKSRLATLNKRNELINTCRHNNKFLLKNSLKRKPSQKRNSSTNSENPHQNTANKPKLTRNKTSGKANQPHT